LIFKTGIGLQGLPDFVRGSGCGTSNSRFAERTNNIVEAKSFISPSFQN